MAHRAEHQPPVHPLGPDRAAPPDRAPPAIRAVGHAAGTISLLTSSRSRSWSRSWSRSRSRPQLTGEPVTLVGSLCPPRDVPACDRPVERLRAGDVVAFAMAGAPVTSAD
jgi:diaminopimelate decarboxylase